MKGAAVLFAGMIALLQVACDVSAVRHTDYPDEQSDAFNVYARNCSGCHAPPLPGAHPAREWANVIARMQLHLVQRSMPPITVADMPVVREYLETHAAQQ